MNKINFIKLIIILTLLLSAVKPPANADPDFKVAIIKNTGEISQFNEVAASFISTLSQKKGFAIEEYDLKQTSPDKLTKQFKKSKIDLIYAIGDKSAAEMSEKTAEIPVIFSMILNYKNPKLKIFNNPKVAGISLEVPAEIVFMQMQMLTPNVKKVGIIYSDKSKEIVEGIRQKQSEFQIEIIESKIESADNISGAFDKLKQEVDAIYMVADPVIYTKDATLTLINECKNSKLPFIAYSDAFVKAGALMSVSPSYSTIGSQAASIAERILIDKIKPESVGVEPPIGTFFVINAITSNEIGITTNEDILSLADKVYRAGENEKK